VAAVFLALADGRKQLAAYQTLVNNHIKTCLNIKSPNHVLEKFIAVIFQLAHQLFYHSFFVTYY